MCVYDSKTGGHQFYNFINTESLLGKKGKVLSQWKIHDEIKDFVKLIYVPRDPNPKDYNKEQHKKMMDFYRIILNIVSLVPQKSIVGLEGFSYASTGRGDIDLIMAQTLLRYELYQRTDVDLIIASPSSIKKSFTGKGNANKMKMFETFKDVKEDEIPLQLQEYVNNNEVTRKDKLLKPIDDLVDAYAIKEYLLKFHND